MFQVMALVKLERPDCLDTLVNSSHIAAYAVELERALCDTRRALRAADPGHPALSLKLPAALSRQDQ